jgi:hypothetical protein
MLLSNTVKAARRLLEAEPAGAARR